MEAERVVLDHLMRQSGVQVCVCVFECKGILRGNGLDVLLMRREILCDRFDDRALF